MKFLTAKARVPALFSVAMCGGWLPVSLCYAAVDPVEQPALLGSSEEIRGEFDAQNVHRVARAFADLRVGARRTVVSPEDLQMMLGPEAPAAAAPKNGSRDVQLPTVEVRRRPHIDESGLQAQIPFGFAGMWWGLEHPTQAWRLLLPVLGGDVTQ